MPDSRHIVMCPQLPASRLFHASPPRPSSPGTPGLLALAFSLAIAIAITGCSTPQANDENEPEGIAGLIIRKPTSDDDWRSVRTDYSQFYVTTRDAHHDEDLIALFVEIVPLMRPVTNEQELLSYIHANAGSATANVVSDTLMGKQVLRFHAKAERAENPARFRQLFGLQPRLADATYIKNSKGILFCHPEDNMLAIRVGIWRNSYHGQIGEHFEQIAGDFASSFLAANALTGQLN